MTLRMKNLPAWISRRFAGLLLAAAAQATIHASVHAAPVTFTFTGTAVNTAGGYNAGSPSSISITMRDYKPETLRVAPDPPYQQSACCAGSWGWYQDLWNQAHLWDEITGTGLTGSWNPVNTSSQTTNSSLMVTLTHSGSNALQLAAMDLGGAATNTGLLANGIKVMGWQVYYNFLGLDVLKAIGDDQFSKPVPDPTELFGRLTGHYDVDPLFTFVNRLWLFDPQQGRTSVDFSFTSVDIATPGATTVPGPGTLSLFAGAAVLLLRRRRAA